MPDAQIKLAKKRHAFDLRQFESWPIYVSVVNLMTLSYEIKEFLGKNLITIELPEGNMKTIENQ